MAKLSEARQEALLAIAAGRVSYGAAYPERERRRGGNQLFSVVLIDGFEVYGAAHSTYGSLLEAGLARARMEDIPTMTAPEEIREYRTISGALERRVIPEREVPVDPGWRVAVELTDAGRALLSRSRA